MIDQVSADRVMLIHRERDFQFRSHAIHAGNQYGIAQPPKTRPKQSPEPADFAEHLRPVSLPSEPRKTALKPTPEINIDARAGVALSLVCPALVWAVHRTAQAVRVNCRDLPLH